MASSGIGPGGRLRLRLYITGDAPGARRAIQSRNRLIEEFGDDVDIEIVDILSLPEEAERAGILATPTLSDESIDPPRRLIGDISDLSQVLEYFGFRRKDIAP